MITINQVIIPLNKSLSDNITILIYQNFKDHLWVTENPGFISYISQIEISPIIKIIQWITMFSLVCFVCYVEYLIFHRNVRRYKQDVRNKEESK